MKTGNRAVRTSLDKKLDAKEFHFYLMKKLFVHGKWCLRESLIWMNKEITHVAIFFGLVKEFARQHFGFGNKGQSHD